MTIEEIRKAFKSESVKVPYFIDPSNVYDLEMGSDFIGILNYISQLITIGYNKDTIKIVNKCNILMQNIEEFLYDDTKRLLMVVTYIHTFLDDLNEILLENEYYEALTNLREFNLYFYKVIID